MAKVSIANVSQIERHIKESIATNQELILPIAGFKGLEIRIRPSQKTDKATTDFRHRYTHPITGKRPYLSLGNYPAFSLAQAKQAYTDNLVLLEQGIDPKEHREQEREQKAHSLDSTFKAVADDWLAEQTNNPDHVLAEQTLKNWGFLLEPLLNEFAETPIDTITTPQVLRLLKQVQKTHIQKGNRVKGIASRIFAHAVINGLIEHNPVTAVKEARAKGHDLVIVDTAGRLAIDEQMMNEIAAIKKALNPDEILFVVDSMTGQDAVNTAKEFNERLDFNGVVLTKLDGDTRGGAARSIRSVTGKPILYVGMGEKLEDLQQFYPDRMTSRILGMGDVLSLIEKAEQTINEEDALRMTEKMKKAEFDFNDFLDQMDQMKKMGGLSNLLSMIPGVGNKMQGLDIDDGMMDKTAAIIYSMTKEERANPKIINASRKRRIAAGAGVPIAEVNRLCKQVQNPIINLKNSNKSLFFSNKLQSIHEISLS